MVGNQAVLWPEQFDIRLRPFPINHTVYLSNNAPNGDYISQTSTFSGISFIELFSGSKQDLKTLKNEHIWGYPAYVMDLKLKRRFRGRTIVRGKASI